jgi:hypothetical protein
MNVQRTILIQRIFSVERAKQFQVGFRPPPRPSPASCGRKGG